MPAKAKNGKASIWIDTKSYPVQIRKQVNGTEYVVKLAAASVEENLTNELVDIVYPITPDQQLSLQPYTQWLDLKQVRHTITVSGKIMEQEINGAVKSPTEVKNILIRHILFTPGEINLKWRTNTDKDYNDTGSDQYLSVAFQAAKIIDSSTIGERKYKAVGDSTAIFPAYESYSEPQYYLIELKFIRGTELE